MTRKSNTAAGWEKELKAAKEVLAFLYTHGARDQRGELVSPYFGWTRKLESDINRLQEWLGTKIDLTEKGKEAINEDKVLSDDEVPGAGPAV